MREEDINQFTSKMTIEERLDFLEFRQELIYYNTEVDKLLFEYNVNRQEYSEIMDLMDEIRQVVLDGFEVSYVDYESAIYKIVKHLNGDYHFCEYIAQAFMNEERWEEVYPALYDNMPKYDELFDL